MILTPGVPVFYDSDLSAPVLVALRDLQRDLQSVFDCDSPLLSINEQLPNQNGIIVTSCDNPIAADIVPGGYEAHAVFVRETPDTEFVCISGTDMRGIIYGIYTFSEKVLGIPPLWYWACIKAEQRQEIPISSDKAFVYESPHVRWRSIFPNDEKMYRKFEGLSDEKFDVLYETMMRLKMNMLETGPLHKFPEEGGSNNSLKRARAAHRRGLALTSHHIYSLASGLKQWRNYWKYIHGREVPEPAMETLNREDLKTFWQDHIRWVEEEGFEMLWTIGFRGFGDQPWFNAVKNAPDSDVERARVMEEMMEFQLEILREAKGEDVMVRTQLYNEGADFFASGALRLPADPNVIWSFSDMPRAHYPYKDICGYTPSVNQPIGYYYHCQFTSTGAHFAQGEGPWKMEKNLKYVNSKYSRPLEFTVVNAGNIREFSFELSAYSHLTWNMKDYDSDNFLEHFCAQYFGEENARQAASLYRDYYLSFWECKKPIREDWERMFIFADLKLIRAIEHFIDLLPMGFTPWPLIYKSGDIRYYYLSPEDSGAATQLEAILAETAKSIQKLLAVTHRCDSLICKISERGKLFFRDNLSRQARFILGLTETLHELALAMKARPRDSARSQNPLIAGHIGRAVQAFSRALKSLREADHSPFENWSDAEAFQLQDNLDKLMKLEEQFSG